MLEESRLISQNSVASRPRIATTQASTNVTTVISIWNPESEYLVWSVKDNLQTEFYGGKPYSYYRLGRYVVAAPGVCGGRPTIKYTRLDARHVVAMVRSGESAEEIASRHDISRSAVLEAVELADIYDYEASYP